MLPSTGMVAESSGTGDAPRSQLAGVFQSLVPAPAVHTRLTPVMVKWPAPVCVAPGVPSTSLVLLATMSTVPGRAPVTTPSAGPTVAIVLLALDQVTTAPGITRPYWSRTTAKRSLV